MQTFQLDGVPVFRVDSDGHEPVVGVYFRVGPHDEDFSTAGMTALTTQLILASLPMEHRDYVDAWSNGLFTHFSISPDAPDVAQTLRALSRAIENISWDRLQQQKILLQTGDGVVGLVGEAHLFHARYGAVGPGTGWIKKLAYSDADQVGVQRWLDRFFVRQNAAIAVVGDAPVGASFPLPDGSAQDFLLLEMLAERLPARVQLERGENAIGVQLTAPMTATTNVAFAVLADTLHRRLIFLESLTPELAVESQMLDANVASFTAVFPVHPVNANAATAAVMQTIEDFGNGLISEDMIERRRGEVLEGGRLSESHWAVDQAAQRSLFPAVQTLEARAAEVSGLGIKDFGDVVRRASADTLLIAAPPEATDVAAQLPVFSHHRLAPTEGVTYRLKGAMRYLARGTSLVVGPTGLSLTDRSGLTTIEFPTAVAVLDSGVALTVVSNTGDMVTIFAEAWKQGNEIEAIIRREVPADRFVKTTPSQDERATAAAVKQGLKAFSGWRLILPVALLVFVLVNAVIVVIGTPAEQQAASLRLAILVAIAVVSYYAAGSRRDRRGNFRA